MKAAELLVHCLENEGVELVFGLPGEETLEVMDALLGSRMRFIETRHEQGAAFMADVYGRLSGKAGVVEAISMRTIAGFLLSVASTRTV